jgi:hypothetical protein
MEPFCSPARRNLEQGEKAKVLTLCGKSKGVTSEQVGEKMDKQQSTATTQWRGEAEAQIGGLDNTGPLGSIVARVTT